MSRRTLASEMQTTPRRSSRLKKSETTPPETEVPSQQISHEHGAGNQQLNSDNLTSRFLELSAEIRTVIFFPNNHYGAPFMIGRCQEERRKTEGSPRDIFSFHKSKFKARRNDDRNRPVQPSITRVCRTFRTEALPLWYSENHFWLIHNEFEPENKTPDPHRGFHAWISQTPRDMFNIMQHVSLCGYSSWPNRVMITIDLKNRQIVDVRHYSTYGDKLPIFQQEFIDSTKQALTSKVDADGLAALNAVLAERDDLFQISPRYTTAPPGMMRREPAHGWEYDW